MKDSRDDPRDALIKLLFQSLGGKSSWLRVSFDHSMDGPDGGINHITLTAVKANELASEIVIMQERIDSMQAKPANLNPLDLSVTHPYNKSISE